MGVKVLTNIRFYTVAGIAQYLSNFIRHNEQDQRSALFLYGVDIMLPGEQQNIPHELVRNAKQFTLHTETVAYPSVGDVVKTVAHLDGVRTAYEPVIAAYLAEIHKVRPDVILVNGTFFLPWCLLQAARRYGKARIIVHYHGVLSKEVEHWKEQQAKDLFLAMEREFDDDNVSYVFPSQHARTIVEQDVFGHPIRQAVILPNPTPEAFFEEPQTVSQRVIGMVSRWTRVKNPAFLVSLARHNRKVDAGYAVKAISDIKSDSPQYKKASGIISFSPPVDNARLPSFYRRLGALIMPSHFETYGNVAQEALATGVPVLVSQHTGFAETLRNVNLDHWVADFTSPAEVLSRLEAIIEAGVPRASWEQLRSEYTNTPVFNKYSSVLRGTL